MAITIGKSICIKTNCPLNHCRLSTSIIPSLDMETRQSSLWYPSLVLIRVNIPDAISLKVLTLNFFLIQSTVQGFLYKYFNNFNCFFVIVIMRRNPFDSFIA